MQLSALSITIPLANLILGGLCLLTLLNFNVVKFYYANRTINTIHVIANSISSNVFEVANLSTRNSPISYQIIRGRHYDRSEVTKYACRNPSTWLPLENRVELPQSNPFDFFTFVQTKLNILVMGDSLGVEFGSWFQNAAQASNKTVLQYLNFTTRLAQGLAFAKVDGGGSIAYWRILGLWERRTQNRPLPNQDKGWDARWVSQLHSSLPPGSDKVNVLIFRVQYPWLGFREIYDERLNETVAVARMYLGEPLTIIFMTVPLNNNVVTIEHLQSFRAMNDRIRSFVMGANSSNVLLSDAEYYMDNVIEWNANQIRMNISDPEYFLSERLVMPGIKYTPHVAHVCSQRVAINSTDCPRNVLLNDGLHFCMESLGPRLFANWACLIQCSYGASHILRQCERDCNDRYFSLNMIW